MAKNTFTEDDLRAYEEYETALARPVLSESDITDELLDALAETGLANFVLNKRKQAGPRPGRVEHTAIAEEWPTDWRLEQIFGVDELEGFEDRKGLLRRTLSALLSRKRVRVDTVVKILRTSKDEAIALAVTRTVENPRVVGKRLTLRATLQKSAKEVLALARLIPADVPPSPWLALYADILEAVKHDPLLNPRPKRRRGQTRHQDVLANTRKQLQRAGVSVTDAKTLLQGAGLITLLKANRSAPPPKKAGKKGVKSHRRAV